LKNGIDFDRQIIDKLLANSKDDQFGAQKRGTGGNMKIVLKWLVIIVVIAVQVLPSGAAIVDRIVAVVNDDIITLSDLNIAFEPYMQRVEETYKGADKAKILTEGRMTILNRLIDNKLIEQQSKKSGLVVKDEEVMATIKGVLKERNMIL
jgi:parvulin-like peptidyl-prolyl isomerase